MVIDLKKYKYEFIMCIIILFSLALMLFHGHYKEYYYEDEILSYTAANNQYGLGIPKTENGWNSGEEMWSNITASPDHRFDYGNVIKNQASDIHPSLFVLILHTICSFFPGTFSKWYVLSINIVATLVSEVLLYMIVKIIVPEKRWVAPLISGLWVCSIGTITQVMFLRSYPMLTMFVLFCALWHVKRFDKEKKIMDYVILFLITFLGSNVQYFYLIFAAFAGFFYALYLLVKKRFKELIPYCFTMIGSVILFFVLWPYIFIQARTKNSAQVTLGRKLSVQDTAYRFGEMIGFVNKELFGEKIKIIIAVVFLLVLFFIVYERKVFASAFKVSFIKFYLLIVAICFFCTTTMVAPYMCDRYVSPSFPFLIMFSVLWASSVSEKIFKRPVVGYILLTCLLILPEVMQLKQGLYDVNRGVIAEMSDKYKNDICLFASEIPTEENIMELKKYDRIYVYDSEKIEDIDEEEIRKASELMVYVSDNEDIDNILNSVYKINPSLENRERVYVAYYSQAWRMYE